MTLEMNRNIATILGVRINSSSTGSLLSEILAFVAGPSLGKVVFTPNPEFLVAAYKDPCFRQILNRSDINLPDGYGLILLSRFTGQKIRGRVSGADLVERLLEMGDKEGGKVGIVGARRGVESEVAILLQKLKAKYPHVDFYNLDDPKLKIKNLKFKVVLACQGMGKQERWILENKDKIEAKVFVGIGGALDFLTGFTKRAPIWMRGIGLEWLWRALQRPGHWKRIWTAVAVFPWLVLRERVASK